MIFVFGSNRAGIHGAGAAQYARLYKGAQWGVGEGHTGDTYAIPTRDDLIGTLPIGEITKHVDTFIQYAKDHLELDFQVTMIGCGYAGYTSEQIAPLFADMPTDNCYIDSGWQEFLPNHPVWGSYQNGLLPSW